MKSTFKRANTIFKEGDIILAQAKKNKEVVYGARALKKRIGYLGLGRATTDWDLYSRRPLKSAKELDRTLDKSSGGNYYYVKPAVHQGTYRVKDKGPDCKSNTDDDRNVADYTVRKKGLRTSESGGVNYVLLSEIVKDRRRALAQKRYAFRHEKDKYDLALIREYQQKRKAR